ncbi:3-oxoacyl-[acyl-carrier protein] reductase [Friedmanniella luteola]|uniref:3-oxoacyl-[acyl-carrier protein] reductase n=1 Tax=Friedmanniella luteola TaxID=546871 RepID=A0A1H1Q9K5_9ACTN|nr:SDR family oxidoreductase [Friedmanniella luteola]SDS20201.1 3-oxoacyl-[acyl-carrier protein] reductase [Friedmanniella luteola]
MSTPTAVVTGSSRGLGAVIARRLAADGWAVAVNYRTGADEADAVVAAVEEAGGAARAYRADVTDAADVHALVASAEADLGPVQAVVANATGPQPAVAIEDLTWEDHLDQLRFFVQSPTLLVQAALPTMKRRGTGRVVLIGSDMVGRALPRASAYTAAKAAQIGLVRSWSRELGPHGVTVNLVQPGWIPVERHEGADTTAYRADVPLGRMGTPDDVAGLVAYLAGDGAGFVTGQQISVNGGHTL